jgi:hypothetical protein
MNRVLGVISRVKPYSRLGGGPKARHRACGHEHANRLRPVALHVSTGTHGAQGAGILSDLPVRLLPEGQWLRVCSLTSASIDLAD